MADLTDNWTELDGQSRAGVIVGTLIIVGATIMAAIWLLRDDMQVLFSGLTPQDAAAAVAELERQKIDYGLAEGGTKILVPGSEVHITRLRLMGSGMPMSGGVGFELFDDSDFGMTEFAQRINYQRAMQGELARTIMAMDEVRHARIHLVMSEGGLFRRDNEVPSASVNLVLNGESRLSADQVIGVQRLVAAAVQGLTPMQVVVLDQHGVTLSKALPDDKQSAAASSQLARKQEVEAYLIGKVDAVLAPWLGAGQVAVSIDVMLNMNQVQHTLESVIPQADGTGIIKLKRESRNWAGAAETRSDGAITTETQYEMGRRVEQIVETPGSIQRLSVAVLIPGTLSLEELSKLEELIMVAVGLNRERGDSIALHAFGEPHEAALFEDQVMPATSTPNVVPARIREQPVDWVAKLSAGNTRLGPLPLSIWLLLIVIALLAWIAFLSLRFASLSRRLRSNLTPLSETERAAVIERLNGWIDKKPSNQSEVTS